MGKDIGHSFAAGQFPIQGAAHRHAGLTALPQIRRWGRVLMAIAGASLLTAVLGPASAGAQAACTSEAGLVDSVCCPSEMLKPYWPQRSPQIHQTFCELLVFPTATSPNGDTFSDRIVDGSLSSDSRASADTMTLPSLWWNRDSLTPRLGGRRLVDSWMSYRVEGSGTAVVDVVVNAQIWSVLTYNERYAVLNQFGTAARDFGYNVRFFQGNSRNYRMMGLYACDFVDQPDDSLSVSLTSEPNVQTCSANLDAGLLVLLQRDLLAEGERRQQAAQATAAENSVQSAKVTSLPRAN
ncbi:MAG: hypothetical protein WBA99_06885 [Nodosilinea sp.]